MKSAFSIIILSFAILGCQSPNPYSKQDLMGEWECYMMKKGTETEKIESGEITFDFGDEKYDYKGFAYKESGEWYIDGPFLVTKIEGGNEKKAGINSLKGDTLILDMVDNGVMMQFYLTKN